MKEIVIDCSLVIYHEDGTIWGVFPPLVRYDPVTAAPIEIIDWVAREAAGLTNQELVDVQTPGDAANPPIKGSKAWPEPLGQDILSYRVELEGKPGAKRIAALIHRDNGARRSRVDADRRRLEKTVHEVGVGTGEPKRG